MASFTCITCRVTFADADLQRAHYKADWHRYNLKRKVIALPPVTAEVFGERVLAQRIQAEEEKKTTSHCQLCGKHFGTENAFINHVNSKKHKEVEAKLQQKCQNHAKTDDTKDDEINIKQSEKVMVKNTKNLKIQDFVQTKTHAKTMGSNQQVAESIECSARPKIRTDKNVVDVKPKEEPMELEQGDLEKEEEEWEGDALGLEECLFCPYIASSLDEKVHHMTSMHSFFIPDIEYLIDLDGLITYLGEKVGEGHMCLWCNQKSRMYPTVRAVQQHMVDKGHCKMLHEGDAVFEYTDYYDYRSSYPDSEELALGEAAGGQPKGEEMEEEVEAEILDGDGFQLVLPSGATLGHKSLQRYYRQKLKPNRAYTPPHAVSKVISHYKALGWTGSTGVDAQRRAKDMQFVQRLKSRHFMKLGIKANKLQKHFRDQVFGF